MESFIGQSVYTTRGGFGLRFGNIIAEKKDGRVRMVRVDWKDDRGFENDRELVKRMRHYDKYSDWYKIGHLTRFTPEQMISTIKKL